MARKGLLLDFGGVLTASLYRRMAEFCVEAGLSANAILDALETEEGRRVTVLAEVGLAPRRDFEEMLARNLGLPDQGLIARLISAVPQRAEMVGLARRARAAGLPVGLRKPERPIFELAAAKLGVAPGDCLLVDDTLANIVTAMELGMAAVHFTGEAGQLAEVEQLTGLSAPTEGAGDG